MDERKTQISLLLSILFALSILEVAVYQEQYYIRSNELGFIAPPYRHMIHLSLIFLNLFFLASIFVVNPFSRTAFLSSITYLILLSVFQFFLLLYGSIFIPLSIKSYQKEWLKTGNNSAISLAETAMQCCGYVDILQAGSYSCPYYKPCGAMIENAKSSRMVQFIVLTICSILFEIYSFYAVFELHSSPPVQSFSEFDELLTANE